MCGVLVDVATAVGVIESGPSLVEDSKDGKDGNGNVDGDDKDGEGDANRDCEDGGGDVGGDGDKLIIADSED